MRNIDGLGKQHIDLATLLCEHNGRFSPRQMQHFIGIIIAARLSNKKEYEQKVKNRHYDLD
jgi:hypothetical protein